MKYLRFLLLVAFCNSVLTSCSQKTEQPFYKDIQAFKDADKKSAPPKNAILFVGSSSFTMWKDVNNDFPGYTIINRGFGGSQLSDVVRYADDVIIPYKPKQVVIYCGDNDIATGSVTATDVLQRFMELFNIIRNNLPDVHIAYVSIKPSPSRAKYMRIIEDANVMIRQFLSGYPRTAYIDIYHPMLDNEGKPRKELFLDDDLHMNEKGYAIWKEAIQPYLVK
jgi:lysophospholipase L1-like esterase